MPGSLMPHRRYHSFYPTRHIKSLGDCPKSPLFRLSPAKSVREVEGVLGRSGGGPRLRGGESPSYNATFLKGTIENVPLPDGSVDVLISNCVINLAEAKGAVIREAFRVLKPGGRLVVSDIVELNELPSAIKKAVDAWAACISGTIPVATYSRLLLEAGFQDAEIEVTQEHDVEGVGGAIASAAVRGRKHASNGGAGAT